MEHVIFTLLYEKKWECWMIYANSVRDAGDFFQNSGRYTGGGEEVPPVIKEITAVIQKYSTSELFRQFGRKRYKDERDFLQKVDEVYIRADIRPYIEKYVVRVLDGLVEAGLPLFLKGGRLDNFYKSERILLQGVQVRALLRFERNGDYTRYVLRLADGNSIFFPSDYDLKILTRRPCRVLSGCLLFSFPEDFDGQRLLPFLEKREVLIPKTKEAEYFRKFILKNVRHEEIDVQGFDVVVQEVEKRMVLSLEREVFGMPVFSVEFYYGKQKIPAWSVRKALVELRTNDDAYAFYKINRDFNWEREQYSRLVSLGLEERSPGYFQVAGTMCAELPEEKKLPDEKDGENDRTSLAWQLAVEWVQQHLSVLYGVGIGFTQKALRREFYIAGWELDYCVRESTDWFELRAEVVLGDGRCIPLIRFRDHILSGRREFLLDDGTVFFIPEEWFADYSDILLFAQGKEHSLFLHKNQYVLLDRKSGISDMLQLPASSDDAVELPLGLRVVMRPYQLAGYKWVYGLYRKGLGGCLADDMGLGKTLQTIALLLKYRQEAVNSLFSYEPLKTGVQLDLFSLAKQNEPAIAGRENPEFHTCLVVVPASLVHNWRNELHKFAPQLRVTVYAGYNRLDLRPFLQTSDVVIVTYQTLRNDIEYFTRLSFGIVVADEAQILKNPDSMVHRAIMRIRGDCFLALSGTPVENSLSDLWAVMNFVNRDLLGTHHFFKEHFIRPIVADVGGRMSAALRRLISPYILRRTKEEVLADLPDLTTELVVCEPEEEQRIIYEEEQSRVRNYILGKREKQEGLRNDFMVLKALIRLRQIANHPRLVDELYAGDSGKFREVFNMLYEVVGAGHKVLVFSSFVKYLNMVADEVEGMGWKYAMLTGATTDREGVIRRFSTEPDCRIFLISLKAGGVGLNLTEADYVFILDPWWNLAAENQAVSRAHRMGQKSAVFVYRFITAGTLEEKILAIQQRKQRLSDVVISNAATVPLNDDELLEALE